MYMCVYLCICVSVLLGTFDYCVAMRTDDWSATIRTQACSSADFTSGVSVTYSDVMTGWNDNYRSYWPDYDADSQSWTGGTEQEDYWQLIRSAFYADSLNTIDVTLDVTADTPYKLVVVFQEGESNADATGYVLYNEVDSTTVGELINADDYFDDVVTDLSYCTWVRTDATSSKGFFSWSTSVTSNAMVLYPFHDITLYLNDQTVSTGRAINDDAWHHVCVSWTSATGDVRFYHNGELDFSTSGFRIGDNIATGGLISLFQEQDSLGGGFNAGQSFVGYQGFQYFYERVLTSTEVADLYNGVAIPENWAFNFEDINAIHDASIQVTLAEAGFPVERILTQRWLNLYVQGEEVLVNHWTAPIHYQFGTAQVLEYYFTSSSATVEIFVTPPSTATTNMLPIINALMLKEMSDIDAYTGCTATSRVAPGYHCSGEPSVCTQYHLGFGTAAGDTNVGQTSSATEITLPSETRFMGEKYNSLFINNNGVLSFNSAYDTWSSTTTLATHGGVPLIAVMWSEWDFPCNSEYLTDWPLANIWYRFGSADEITATSERVREIYGAFTFDADYVLIVTYHGDVETCDRVDFNYVQVVIAVNSVRTYVLWQLSEDSLRWTAPEGVDNDPSMGVHNGDALYRSFSGYFEGTTTELVSDMYSDYSTGLFMLRVDAAATPYEPVATHSTNSLASSISFSGGSWAPDFESSTDRYDVTFYANQESFVNVLLSDRDALLYIDDVLSYSGEDSAGYNWPDDTGTDVVVRINSNDEFGETTYTIDTLLHPSSDKSLNHIKYTLNSLCDHDGFKTCYESLFVTSAWTNCFTVYEFATCLSTGTSL